jgi:hypothetical protein
MVSAMMNSDTNNRIGEKRNIEREGSDEKKTKPA